MLNTNIYSEKVILIVVFDWLMDKNETYSMWN